MIWHSAVLDADQQYFFKVYLNPQIHGKDAAPALMREALTRLQLPHAWSFIENRLNNMGERTQLVYFSLDLTPGAHARVKIYLSNVDMTMSEFDLQLQGSSNYIAGNDVKWVRTLTGNENSLDTRIVLNYFSFTADKLEPVSNTQVPIRWYVVNDAVAIEKAQSLMLDQHKAKLCSVMNNMAGRPLEKNRGLLAHISIRQEKDELCVITYLSAEAYTYTHVKG